MALSILRLTARKLSAVISIFESDFRTQNVSFSPPFTGFGRRWIFFESDFRTPNFSFSPPYLGCGRRWIVFWVRFSDPKFFYEPTNFLIVADAAYLLSPICRSQRTFWWLLSLAFLCLISADLTTTLSTTLGPKLTGAFASNFLTIVVGITYLVIRMSNIYFSKLTYRQILCITDLITLYRKFSKSGSSQNKDEKSYNA